MMLFLLTLALFSSPKMGQSIEVRVTLDVYSGRPNPSWMLSQSDAQDLLQMLNGLPRAEPSEFFDGLGYRGFVLDITTPETSSTTQITLYKGRVRYADGSDARFFADNERQIERWLLSHAKPYIERSLYKYVKKELKKP